MADDGDDGVLGEDGDGAGDLDHTYTLGSNEEFSTDPMAVLMRHHPECKVDYIENVAPKISLAASPPNGKDPNHRSPPFLTQYERTKIIGLRANQLSQSARPYITVPEYVTNVWEIAKLELAQRRLPFIVRRPMPDGSHEYWRLSDLLIL
jgi:DNA-directed RNA polymerase I, II, and III subunit RPABC2